MSRNIDDEMREHALRIMEALSGVDEELLERCSQCGDYGEGQEPEAEYVEERRRTGGRKRPRSLSRRPIWRSLGAWAAALLFLTVGIAGWQGYQFFGRVGSDSSMWGNMMQNKSAEGTGMGSSQEGQKSEDESGNLKGAPEPETAGNMTTDGLGQEDKMAYDKYEGTREEGTAQNGGEDPRSGDTREECRETDGVQGPEDSIADTEPDEEKCFELNALNHTEQEARELEGLGGYVPDALPEGYVFDRAYTNLDLERENLTVCWNRGTDYILLHLERTEGALETVETEKPETYDQRLYKIPYGETVPEEYRQILLNPLFAWDDLDLGIIESRMTVYEDAGDTDTPRGNFRVLYPEGIMVSFRGRGTAEEIWDMFCSMGK